MDTRLPSPVNNLARNGAQAVKLAEQLCGATGQRNPSFLETLAAAYVEVGRFDGAEQNLGGALEILAARPARADDLVTALRRRMGLDQARQSYRDALNQARISPESSL